MDMDEGVKDAVGVSLFLQKVGLAAGLVKKFGFNFMNVFGIKESRIKIL